MIMRLKYAVLLAVTLSMTLDLMAEVKLTEGLTYARYGIRELQHDLFNPEKQNESPRRHLDKGDPPMLFITGERDNSDTHAEPIRRDMQRLKIPSGLLVIPDALHAFLPDERSFNQAMSAAAHFFDENLKGIK